MSSNSSSSSSKSLTGLDDRTSPFLEGDESREPSQILGENNYHFKIILFFQNKKKPGKLPRKCVKKKKIVCFVQARYRTIGRIRSRSDFLEQRPDREFYIFRVARVSFHTVEEIRHIISEWHCFNDLERANPSIHYSFRCWTSWVNCLANLETRDF